MDKPKKKPRSLTPRELKLVKLRAEGKTLAQAGLQAGYGTTPSSAAAIACGVLKKSNVQQALEASLDKAGASLDASAKVIADAHGAVNGVKPDHTTRLRAAELNYKARRIFGTSQEEGGTGDKMSIAILIVQERMRRGLDPIPGHIDTTAEGDTHGTV